MHRPTPKPSPVCDLGVLRRHRLQERSRRPRPEAAGDAARRGDRGVAVLVDIDDLLDAGDPLVAVERDPLDPLGQLDHLGGLGGRDRRSRRPSISAARRRAPARPSSRPRRRPARRRPRPPRARRGRPREVGAVGVAGARADPGADPHAAAARLGEALDLTGVDADLAARGSPRSRPRRRWRRRRWPPRPRGAPRSSRSRSALIRRCPRP